MRSSNAEEAWVKEVAVEDAAAVAAEGAAEDAVEDAADERAAELKVIGPLPAQDASFIAAKDAGPNHLVEVAAELSPRCGSLTSS